jgi:RNA-directed DNA polymerase
MSHPWNPQQFATEAQQAGRSPTVIAASRTAGIRIKQVDPDLPVILTLAHLAALTGTPFLKVTAYARRATPSTYRIFRMKKRGLKGAPSRGDRIICVPEPTLMRLQRWIAQNLLRTSAAAPHPSSFAYYRERGLLAAARRHAGCSWLVKMDIRDFFDSVTERRVYRVFRSLGYGALLSFQLARICTRARDDDPPHRYRNDGVPGYYHPQEGRLPQGAPTSPGLANLVVRALDVRLKAVADARGWIYTRYADDLAFSTQHASDRAAARELVEAIRKEVVRFGFSPNNAKTVIAGPGSRRIVLGLLVDGQAPKLTRDFRNRIETHLYALRANTIGPAKHRRARKFASLIGMRRHICGLISFAFYVDPAYGQARFDEFNEVDWTR